MVGTSGMCVPFSQLLTVCLDTVMIFARSVWVMLLCCRLSFRLSLKLSFFYSVLLSMVMIVKTGKLHQKIDLCFKFNPNPRKVKQQFFINVATCKIKLQMVINSDQQGLNRRPCRDTIRGQ